MPFQFRRPMQEVRAQGGQGLGPSPNVLGNAAQGVGTLGAQVAARPVPQMPPMLQGMQQGMPPMPPNMQPPPPQGMPPLQGMQPPLPQMGGIPQGPMQPPVPMMQGPQMQPRPTRGLGPSRPAKAR